VRKNPGKGVSALPRDTLQLLEHLLVFDLLHGPGQVLGVVHGVREALPVGVVDHVEVAAVVVPRVAALLMKAKTVEKVLSGNMYRVMKQVWV
jgi:hypothetical protein